MTALSATLQTPGESPPAFLSRVIIVGDRLKGSLSSTATAADLIDTLIAFYATANVEESSENEKFTETLSVNTIIALKDVSEAFDVEQTRRETIATKEKANAAKAGAGSGS